MYDLLLLYRKNKQIKQVKHNDHSSRHLLATLEECDPNLRRVSGLPQLFLKVMMLEVFDILFRKTINLISVTVFLRGLASRRVNVSAQGPCQHWLKIGLKAEIHCTSVPRTNYVTQIEINTEIIVPAVLWSGFLWSYCCFFFLGQDPHFSHCQVHHAQSLRFYPSGIFLMLHQPSLPLLAPQ